MREFAEHADARRLVRAARRRQARSAGGVAGSRQGQGGSKRRSTRRDAKDSLQAFGEADPRRSDGEARIVSDPPLIVPLEELVTADAPCSIDEFLSTALREYRRTLPADRRHLLDSFRFVDMARKVVGVGSVGTRAWIAAAARPRRRRSAASCRSRRRSRRCSSRTSGASRFTQPRPAGGRGPAADAGGERHLPRLVRVTAASTGSRATSTSGSCGTARARPTSTTMRPARAGDVRRALRLDAGARARPLRRPDRDRLLPGAGERSTAALADVRRGLRRPERARPRRTRDRHP